MSANRDIAQIAPRIGYWLTVINTVFLYPKSDIEKGLATTEFVYTLTGNNIVCPDMINLKGVYNDIVLQTINSQPIGNAGYSLGVGTMLQDYGEELNFMLASGEIVVQWRLAKQMTPQLPEHVIPVPGNSPANTVGYVTVFCSYGKNAPGEGLDPAFIVRTG
jgi:hypothetical protein